MLEASEQTVQRLHEGAALHQLGPVTDVAHVPDGGTAKFNILGGIALMVGCAVGALVLFFVLVFLRTLFYVAFIFLALGFLAGPVLIIQGVRKAMRGETFMAFTPTGAVAVRERRPDLFAFPFASTTVKTEESRAKDGRVRSVTATIANATGQKLKVTTVTADELDSFNRVVTHFPGQAPMLLGHH